MSLFYKLLTLISLLFILSASSMAQKNRAGYTDTPLLPHSKWRVHDSARPYPRIVQGNPLFLPAPKDATVLFDGKDMSAFHLKKKNKNQKAQPWLVRDGYMEVNRAGTIASKQSFGSCQLHIEWASPAKVSGKGQGRGNSGVFLMSRYELQILDSYQNNTYADGQAASLYGQYPPMVNACMPAGEWQSYDIFFTAPVFDGKKLLAPARITVLHNGILVQNNVAFIGNTSHRSTAKYTEHGLAPIELQDHGNPVRFRNIWIRPIKSSATH